VVIVAEQEENKGIEGDGEEFFEINSSNDPFLSSKGSSNKFFDISSSNDPFSSQEGSD